MTEVRRCPYGGVGLFATKAFQEGDIIVEESGPLVVLSPSTKAQKESLLAAVPPTNQKQGLVKTDDVSFFSSIQVPEKIEEKYRGKFRGMIQAATCFVEILGNESIDTNLSTLYHPSLTEPSSGEEPVVKVAQEALKFLQNHSKTTSITRKVASERPQDTLKIMLIWACNAFEGGRIYEKQSRINHSCDPNAMIQTEEEKQIVKTAAPIQPGQEITISYLGVMLYAERKVRRDELFLRKHFHCECTRCMSSDVAGAIPCPYCHTRNGRYLEEDVQYDDDYNVKYSIQTPQSKDSLECQACGKKVPLNGSDPTSIHKLSSLVSAKVVAYFHDKETKTAANTRDDEEDEAVEEEMCEQLLQLAMSVTGAKHWTSNLMLLESLIRMLNQQHDAMVSSGDPPSLEDVAQAIDSLERIRRFVEGLHLSLHMGHLLSDVVIGVARSLVSLGDEKSQKYAADWVAKVSAYAQNFENAGIQKVVEALLVAWKKEKPFVQNTGKPSKKQRLR